MHTFAYAREEESKKGMDGSQVTGASSSYARKYALNGMFCIDDNKDFDDPANEGSKAKQQENRLPILTIQGVKDWNVMLNMFYTSASVSRIASTILIGMPRNEGTILPSTVS